MITLQIALSMKGINMKTEILRTVIPKPTRNYPKVMQYLPASPDSTRMLIVMFTEDRKGIVLFDNEKLNRPGTLEEGFFPCTDPACWKPFSGDLKLCIRNGQ